MSSEDTLLIKVENHGPIRLDRGSSGKDLAEKLHLNSPSQALAIKTQNRLYDLDRELSEGEEISIIDFDAPEGKSIFWHTSAHVLAQAVLRIWPNAKATIGPSIEEGFYYDFANLSISEEDFEKIEEEIKKIIEENHRPERKVFKEKDDLIRKYQDNKYKIDLIRSIEDAEVSAYQQGEFLDLCKGPHLPSLGKIKALKILKTSGAYWKGDSRKEMLTRIYGISFPDRKKLKEYLKIREEAKKRDHKILGPKLDLFSLREEAPGMPIIHPKGMLIWNALMDFWRTLHAREHYKEIKTPVMMSRDLWERSGHWNNYMENMYTSSIDEREFAIKPMNCPGCMLYYANDVHSYRELPLRIAEIGNVHRAEPSGAISGLIRVRSFHQDDAHLFVRPSQIEDEVLEVLKLADEIYSTFGLTYRLELSTRPEKDTIGSNEDWNLATTALRNALTRSEREFRINEGDGAFYGPKIDYHIRDAIGRTWQCGTIQLDMALPERFHLEYTTPEGTKRRPIMLHRALYGSIERFIAILIEHFAGRFPLWLSPSQVCIVAIADRHVEHAKRLSQKIQKGNILCSIDDSNESVSKKIRNAQLKQYNYILTVGDREVQNNNATLRTRDNVVHGEIDIEDFIEKISEEKSKRQLSSPYFSNNK